MKEIIELINNLSLGQAGDRLISLILQKIGFHEHYLAAIQACRGLVNELDTSSSRGEDNDGMYLRPI